MRLYVLAGVLFAICLAALAQHTPAPYQMKLKLLFQKEKFKSNETPIVQIEFLNISTETLCFPPPNQECTDPTTGSVEVRLSR